MRNSWEEIWSSKKAVTGDKNQKEFERFCELKKANGFDVAVENQELYYRAFYDAWFRFYDKVRELAGGNIRSIFEVGCGNGVNLYLFQNRQKFGVGGGIDYAASMIESARAVTGFDDLSCCGADCISVEPRYDVVMSESVFQYFESLEYAERVLRKMIEKSRKVTYLGEVHNAEFQKELIDLRKRTIENYTSRYEGLTKLFLEKDWIEKIAADYGKKVIYTQTDNPEYVNGKYLFNCYIL